MDLQEAYDKLIETHPVTVDGDVPDKAARRKVSPEHQQSLYNRWLKVKMRLRMQHVLSHFCRRLPKEERVSAWINKQGWRTNIPSAGRIVSEWKPSASVDGVMDSKRIQRLTRNQNWKGLLTKNIDGKGKGVVATRTFQAGEVVCDYHGQIATAQAGKNIHQSTSAEETGYMFFYTNSRQQNMCIDAHSPSCECHPGKETFGRLINHSHKKFNLKPRYYSAEIDGQEKDVILFFATKNIDVNEELLFDYGVQKKSFRGESFAQPLVGKCLSFQGQDKDI
ncbi:hypothetical protein AAFF_G00393010 [Aldrovandia affinis]|uniref:SET domain-containing protein n=1 Tax=Aldrovandia affinis TaxID=143900 RepID=A0AAD7R3V6_9TELE|nr:hypothetical protein AAFF_G00393010 [Aldrovandia affinis]